MNCTQCGSADTRRSHRHNALDWISSQVHIYPYRCAACSARFRAPRGSMRANSRGKWRRLVTQSLIYGFVLMGFALILYALIQERSPAE